MQVISMTEGKITQDYISGLLASHYFDLPAGPAIVWGISLMIPICLLSKTK